MRHPYPKVVLYSLFFTTDILAWRHVGVIYELTRSYRPRLGLLWAIIEALAGWNESRRMT